MNDITALSQREKFEAWWEITYHNGNPPRFGWAYWREAGGYKIDDDEPELDSMWNAWQAAGVQLVEALEAEQQKSAKQGRHACELFDEVKRLQEQLRTVELSNSVLESRTVTVKLPPEFSTIGENIRTQDNRITSDPMFCVFQKREIVVDADFTYDRIVWVDEDGNEANKRQSARLELLHENFREPPEKWRRVAVKEIDDFVTCCFTEKGCKDYLASNGHNLRLPFIYVKSGFRNAEYIGLRNWLAGIQVIEGEGQ